MNGPAAIEARLTPQKAGTVESGGSTVHFVLEAKMAPGRNGISATGSIDISSDGRKVATIPVSCTLERPYHLSRETFERPGGDTTSELFFEVTDPGWRPREIASEPAGIAVTIEPFDATTRRIVARSGRSEVDQKGKEGPAEVVVRTEDGHEVRIPLRGAKQ